MVQFVTDVEECCKTDRPFLLTSLLLRYFLQPYAAAKAREYLEKPALHETMVKVFVSSRSMFPILFEISKINFTMNNMVKLSLFTTHTSFTIEITMNSRN